MWALNEGVRFFEKYYSGPVDPELQASPELKEFIDIHYKEGKIDGSPGIH